LFKSISLLTVALAVGACASAPTVPANLHFRRVVLSPDPVEQELLSGPPQTGGMRSGRVVLKAGEAMHRHSTNANEELLVFLQGKARVLLGNETVAMEAGQVLYIPPKTEHEVHNDGPDELRYIYTVAPAGR
jgi:mannose-6-phosphate isomerase-like protein (cupin superfamily)